MGKLFSEIDDRLKAFIEEQHMFFVATAPAGMEGHVNCSPKGMDTFKVLDGTRVGYVDFVASGVETIAHIRENGRVVVMFCSFQGPPKILRLYGRGRLTEPMDPGFDSLFKHFSLASPYGVRAIIEVELTRIADSCGYSIPLYGFEGHRDQLTRWAERKGPEALEEFRRERNAASIDGLPGLPSLDRERK